MSVKAITVPLSSDTVIAMILAHTISQGNVSFNVMYSVRPYDRRAKRVKVARDMISWHVLHAGQKGQKIFAIYYFP